MFDTFFLCYEKRVIAQSPKYFIIAIQNGWVSSTEKCAVTFFAPLRDFQNFRTLPCSFSIYFRLKQLIAQLREGSNAIDTDTLISNLEYVSDVVNAVATKAE